MINVVQIGANVGKSISDAVWVLIEKNGWNGVFVEPHPDSFKELVKYYSQQSGQHSMVEAAVVPSEGHCVPGGVKLYFNKACQDNNEQATLLPNHYNHKNVDVTYVKPITLRQLFSKFNLIGVEFDLLNIDVEGYDGDILIQTNFDDICPKYIRVETVHMTEEYNEKLTKHLKKWKYEIVDDFFWEEYADHIALMQRKYLRLDHKHGGHHQLRATEPKSFNTLYKKG